MVGRLRKAEISIGAQLMDSLNCTPLIFVRHSLLVMMISGWWFQSQFLFSPVFRDGWLAD